MCIRDSSGRADQEARRDEADGGEGDRRAGHADRLAGHGAGAATALHRLHLRCEGEGDGLRRAMSIQDLSLIHI